MSNAGLSMFSLSGKTALVTGGGSGLGRAMAHALAEAGARVAIVGRRREALEETVAEAPPGSRIVAIVHDVLDYDHAANLVAELTDLVGVPTILVNNAGIHLKKPAVDVTADEFKRVLDTHLVAGHTLVSAVLPGMRSSGGGSIMYIASMASLFGIPGVVAYAAAKAGMLGVVRTLAVELGADDVRVNAIAPGWIDSPMMRSAMEGDPARLERVLGRTPLGRLGDGSDIGAAAVYLASDAARFVTGSCLAVDGGASIGF
jgi:NAD(P)-dependent dehydrogenase (short-subunit alcohol dehydrogenase family)